MYSTLILLSALCVQIAFAGIGHTIELTNNSGKETAIGVPSTERWCYCLKNTQTATIKGINGGDIKLFSKSDCTGNYSTLKGMGKISNAQWVNSISFGVSGSSTGPYSCPNFFNL
ncbi:hypothetical protein BGZ51_009704 [Haplosporangium sp. Z 767]|nr:hypothetical protein BGZ51_009704 [Haplosporangium sp. Z 767]KAF9194077.1 hypothetical protein BGZ50_006742 [Haplosporangium sp. Z 11]